jgi:3',5'-cyclic AMP phosphodiesterase CpdA
MVRLAHVSDIHITAPLIDWSWRDWLNKRFAAWLNFRVLGRCLRFRHAETVLARIIHKLEERVDHVIFSGDATALGFPGEMRRAADLLRVGALPGLAVPGNHDYCTVPAATSGNFERSFAPWQQGIRVDDEIYPFAQKVGHAWLIGVNTATGNRWAWDAGGAAGEPQRQRLARLLEKLDGGPRILVTHFPVCLSSGKREGRTHGLRDLSALVDVAHRGGVSLWLHGHRHGAYALQTPALSPFPVICAGSATQTGLWTHGEYTLDDHRLEGVRRIYDLKTGSFVEAAILTPDSYPMITLGCRAGSGSACRISSRTIHGTLPSPKSRKPMLAAMGLSMDQPK